MGIELRSGDDRTAELIAPLHHAVSAACVNAERTVNTRLQGGCQVPIACFAQHEAEGQLWLRALVGRPDGSEMLRAEGRGDAAAPEQLGEAVAEALLAQGADSILRELGD